MRGYPLGLVFVLCLAVFAASATADTSSSSDVVNPKTYGNCRVQTSVDMLTDEVTHLLMCAEETFLDATGVAIAALKGGILMTMLTKGVMFHLNEEIPVAFRIDKGKLRKGQWYWEGNGAYTFDEHIATVLLNELPTGRRIAIQVGEESGHVVLDGSAAAVKDFLGRIGRQ